MILITFFILFFLPKRFIDFAQKFHGYSFDETAKGYGPKSEIVATIFQLICFIQSIMIRALTRYFPFRLFHQTRLTHYQNVNIDIFLDSLERKLIRRKIPIQMGSGERQSLFLKIYFSIQKDTPMNEAEFIEKLERTLSKLYSDIYIRFDEKGYHLLIPNTYL